ncbi:hypothetical protein Dsin_028407 [Dipteronia sinensis]|uniref:RNase H type-1 domain-containing protein n=1 Tax=Dipteronia sinensis TaxID=43782 RepID=A0AAE0DUH8_9ROSI|nr:hypothetical protein Dsin_028407 [Dipteronia sinensis]
MRNCMDDILILHRFGLRGGISKAAVIKSVVWSPPAPSWIKVNTYCVVLGSPGVGGCGGIFRNCKVFVKSCFAIPLGQDLKQWFLSLPSSLRLHYSSSRIIKVQTSPNRSPIELFTFQNGVKSTENALVVHGLGLSSFSFRGMVDSLGSRGVRVIAVDLHAWNIESSIDFSLDRPVGQVYSMIVANEMLLAGAQDGDFLAWKGSSETSNPFQLAVSTKGHICPVIYLAVGGNMLYSGSMDNTIRQFCILEFDNASKGNPGQAGAGAVLRAEDGSVVLRLRQGVGIVANNVAAYRALILGLKYALKKGFKHIRVHGDSMLVSFRFKYFRFANVFRRFW